MKITVSLIKYEFSILFHTFINDISDGTIDVWFLNEINQKTNSHAQTFPLWHSLILLLPKCILLNAVTNHSEEMVRTAYVGVRCWNLEFNSLTSIKIFTLKSFFLSFSLWCWVQGTALGSFLRVEMTRILRLLQGAFLKRMGRWKVEGGASVHCCQMNPMNKICQTNASDSCL